MPQIMWLLFVFANKISNGIRIYSESYFHSNVSEGSKAREVFDASTNCLWQAETANTACTTSTVVDYKYSVRTMHSNSLTSAVYVHWKPYGR